ncbi:MAG: hypothetical protein WAX38_01745, partial [Minisyncoccia bacterium]
MPTISHAYGVQTHAELTRNMFREYEKTHAPLFTQNQQELAAEGAVHEDEAQSEYGFGATTARRPLNHFYDPIHNTGLNAYQGTITGLPSPLWAIDTKAQANYGNRNSLASSATLFSADSDYSWNRAVYEYVHGDKDRAAQTLGHTLHLLEDATSPAHTRNDPHPGIGGDFDPYENYTEHLVPQVVVNQLQVPHFSSPQSAIQELALYTNTHFFSRDSVDAYVLPRKDELEYREISAVGYGYVNNVSLIKIDSTRKSGKEVLTYTYPNNDAHILTSNWHALSAQAVTYGVGLIELFARAVAEENRTHALLDSNMSEVQLARLQEGKKFAALFTTTSALSGSQNIALGLEPLTLDEAAYAPVRIAHFKDAVTPVVTPLQISPENIPAPIMPPSVPHIIQNTPTLFTPTPPQSPGIVLGASIDTTVPITPQPFTLSGGAGQGGGGGAPA